MTNNSDDKCPIWGTQAEILAHNGDRRTYISARAGGSFEITSSALAMLSHGVEDWKKISLTEQIWQSNRLRETILVKSTDIEGAKHPQPIRVGERLNRFLLGLQENYPELGEAFSQRDVAVGVVGLSMLAAMGFPGGSLARYADQIQLFVDTSFAQGLLETVLSGSYNGDTRISAKGWEKIEALGAAHVISDQIFVAMWFGSEEQSRLYRDAIKPAIEASGYNCVRIDDTEHNEKIDDQILSEIRKSKAIVVDLTCGLSAPQGNWTSARVVGAPRGGVFFEAGFAAGLGLPIIWCVKQEIANVENVVHFDVRQYNQLRWSDDLAELKDRLKFRIEATMGRGNAN